MDSVAASCSQLLAIQSTLVNRALASLDESEIWQRPGEQSNSIGWILGHMTWSRNAMLHLMGGDPEVMPWGSGFARGAESADRAAYPATDVIVSALKQVNRKLRERMETLTDADLSAQAAVPTPSPDRSVRGAIAFLTFHDGYHVGQIAYVMKMLGKPGLVG